VAHFTIVRLDRVGSTNDVARDLAEKGAEDGTLVVAAEQTSGRGRHGRSWHSPRGNFYGSLILRPARPLADSASLSLVIALAALRAVERLARRPLDLLVKWPNDLLLRGGKLAGILLEGAADKAGWAAWLVAGLGVNLRSYPESAAHPGTSLAEEGVEGATPDAFLDAYLAELELLLPVWRQGGFAPLRDAWLARAAGLGQPVQLRLGDSVRRGRLADLAPDGSILLENPMGCLEKFTAGELFFPGHEPGLSGVAHNR